MSFMKSLNIPASGLSAQKLRLDVVADNIANQETTRTQSGGPYRRKMVVMQSVQDRSFKKALQTAYLGNAAPGGVKVRVIADDQTELNPVYDPEHPDANEDGYVLMPNIDMVKETVDGMAASRAYEANVSAFNAMKLMMQKALEIGK